MDVVEPPGIHLQILEHDRFGVTAVDFQIEEQPAGTVFPNDFIKFRRVNRQHGRIGLGTVNDGRNGIGSPDLSGCALSLGFS